MAELFRYLIKQLSSNLKGWGHLIETDPKREGLRRAVGAGLIGLFKSKSEIRSRQARPVEYKDQLRDHQLVYPPYDKGIPVSEKLREATLSINGVETTERINLVRYLLEEQAGRYTGKTLERIRGYIRNIWVSGITINDPEPDQTIETQPTPTITDTQGGSQ